MPKTNQTADYVVNQQLSQQQHQVDHHEIQLANNLQNLKIATSVANSHKADDLLQQSQRKIGSIADYDPLNYDRGDVNSKYNRLNNNSLPESYASLQLQQQQQQQQQQLQSKRSNQQIYDYSSVAANVEENINLNFNDIKTSVFKAIYDYDAKEDDEISFRDGDKFTNCEQIDVGWMIGVHEKTGKHGMFPANYAEPVDLF